nr:HepT-like ribonuclease domain-containing protein [uncultured Oscillibacter sp.]
MEKIKEYCVSIEESVSRHGTSFDAFQEDQEYQHSAAFRVLQIGELVGKLSEDYRNATKSRIPWTQIKALRNVVVHDYGRVNIKALWDTITVNIPELNQFCGEQIAEDE